MKRNVAAPTDSILLVFDWASRQDTSRRLALWLIVALVLHTIPIALLRMAPPPAPARTISDAVLYISSGLPGEMDAFKAFVGASSPDLFAPGRVRHGLLTRPQLPSYKPSFVDVEFKPLPLPSEVVRVLPPLDASILSGVVSSRPAPDTAAGAESPSTQLTQVSFSDGFSFAESMHSLTEVLSQPLTAPLLPAVFLVGVDGAGRARHVFLRSGSGDAGRDALALQDLMRGEFTHATPGEALRWGTVTIYWGNPVSP